MYTSRFKFAAWGLGALAWGTLALSSFASVTVYTTADQNFATITPTNITGLSVALSTNKRYAVIGELYGVTNFAGGTAIDWMCAYSAAGAAGNFATQYTAGNGTAAGTGGFTLVTGASNGGNTQSGIPYTIRFSGTILTGANAGNLTAQAYRNVAGAHIFTIYRGSWMNVREATVFDVGDTLNDDFSTESTTQPPSQASTLQLLYDKGLSPCNKSHCSPTPTPTASPTGTPTATPATVDFTDVIAAQHQHSIILLMLFGACLGLVIWFRV